MKLPTWGSKSPTTTTPTKQPSPEKMQQLQTRREPLLSEPIRPNVGTNETDRSSCCARIFFACMPLLSCTLVIAFLYILIYEGDTDPTKVVISQAMAEYEPQHEIQGVALMGGICAIITTIAREIQIRVYFSRDGSYTYCLKATNSIGALANVIAYVGYVLAAFNNYDAEDEMKAIMHGGGILLFFVLAPLYACLQCGLLFKQTQYSLFIKIVFLFVAVIEYALAIGYLVMKDRAIQLQWYAFALIPLYTGLFFILFLIDPVDDELKEYFSFGCCGKKDAPGKGRNVSPAKSQRSALEMA